MAYVVTEEPRDKSRSKSLCSILGLSWLNLSPIKLLSPLLLLEKKSSKMREITLNLIDKPFGYFNVSTPSQVYMRNG